MPTVGIASEVITSVHSTTPARVTALASSTSFAPSAFPTIAPTACEMLRPGATVVFGLWTSVSVGVARRAAEMLLGTS